ncbi:MAG: MlaD family protein [Ignavibacteria bacterium]|nr:MlaD family protein [Ignavibacteria bacterium]
MKQDLSNKIKLGVFVTLGVAVLIIGIYFVGERQQLFRSTFRVSAVFKDVAGLQAGNNVRFSGINVGTVESISVVSDTSVRVEILIDEDTRKFIKKNAVASIGSEGLMGNKILIISPGIGTEKQIEDNDKIATVQPVNMDEILVSLKTTIDNTSNVTSDLSKITHEIQAGKGTIGKLFMDKSIANNFDSSIVNLNQSLLGLKNLVGDAKISFAQNFDSTFVNLKSGSAEFRKLMEKAKSSWLLWGF